MCRAATCKTCGKTTWAGCGQHVDAVRRSVPASQWCGGKHTQAEIDAAKAARGSVFSRLLNR
jgi:hypothetical protein